MTLQDKITFDNLVSTFRGIPVYTSDFVDVNTAVLINKKTGAGKIIAYEERIQQLEKENAELKARITELEKCYDNMEDQRDELRAQIRGVKFLDRHKVHSKVYDIVVYYSTSSQTKGETVDKIVNAVCSLALPDKEKIIKAILSVANLKEENLLNGHSVFIDDKIMEQIAKKIQG